MPRECTICVHPDRPAIEFGLANRASMVEMEKRYNVGKPSLYRHKANHMQKELIAALMLRGRIPAEQLEEIRTAEGEGIVQTLVLTRARIFRQMDKAELTNDSPAFLAAVAQLHRNVELMGKVLGQLPSGGKTINNIMIAPQYHAFRAAIVYAVQPFGPEVQKALIDAIESIETSFVPAIEMH